MGKRQAKEVNAVMAVKLRWWWGCSIDVPLLLIGQTTEGFAIAVQKNRSFFDEIG
jgi:hypothetical protein